MLRAKLSTVATLMLASGMGLLGACSTATPDQTANWSPNRLYTEARSEVSAGSYDKAIPLFERLEGRAAGTPLAQQAQLEKAYAHFKAGEKAEAIATLDRFLRLHPASPAADYALYLKGLVNFNDELGMFSFLARQDLSERDQKAARESYDAFRDLVNRFPESRYAADARSRMTYIVNSVAEYEVHVARYYYRRGAYVAAINRAQAAIAEYKEVPALEEALFILHRSYQALGMEQLSADARRVLETNYPNSDFLVRGTRQRQDPWWKVW